MALREKLQARRISTDVEYLKKLIDKAEILYHESNDEYETVL